MTLIQLSDSDKFLGLSDFEYVTHSLKSSSTGTVAAAFPKIFTALQMLIMFSAPHGFTLP